MLVLASMSPRRKDIMKSAGYEFVVSPADADEELPSGAVGGEAARIIAERKAKIALSRFTPDDIIVAADTIVCLNGQIIGKPRDEADAARILKSLSGNTHTVFTGFCVIHGNNIVSSYEATNVTFRTLDDDEIESYIKSGEPMDKAGAYGLQGRGCTFACRIDGDYFNVIGLPICRIHNILKAI